MVIKFSKCIKFIAAVLMHLENRGKRFRISVVEKDCDFSCFSWEHES